MKYRIAKFKNGVNRIAVTLNSPKIPMLLRRIEALATSDEAAPDKIVPTTGNALDIAVFVMLVASISPLEVMIPAIFKYAINKTVTVVKTVLLNLAGEL